MVQQIINTLTQAIISGELKPGDRIPTEIAMAQQMGVARTSVREATKILTYLGILEGKRSEGTFVTDGFRESMIDPMVYGVLITSGQDFDHLMELRQTMESGIMRLAIKHRTPEGLQKLHDRLNDMKEIARADGDPDQLAEELFEADNAFHNTVSELCDNPLTDKIDRVVRVLTHSVRHDTVVMKYKSGKADELIAVHQSIFNIIAGRNERGLDEAVEGTYFLNEIRKKEDRKSEKNS